MKNMGSEITPTISVGINNFTIYLFSRDRPLKKLDYHLSNASLI